MRAAEWVRLTNRVVESAKAAAAYQFLRDSEPKGFGVRIAPSGRNPFFLEYIEARLVAGFSG
jgi:hypothetical protein